MLPLRHLLAPATLVLLAAGSAHAQTLTYNVCLDGAQETPPIVTAATGTGTVTLDTSTGMASLSGSYQNLGTNQTLAHVHIGAIGVPGGIVFNLNGTGGTTGTFSGGGVLSPAQSADLQAGLYYINIHTVGISSGELRGQIVQLVDSTCPAEMGTDPVLADNAGNTAWGPKIGSAVEPFNLSIDCSNATAASVYVIELRPGKAAVPVSSKWGFLYLTGPKLIGTSGAHSMDVRSWFAAPATLPNDVSLPGLSYHAQGFCGGFSPNGRTSNSLTQTIGI